MAEQRSLGQVIRTRRIELDWSQEDLADRISTAADQVRQSEISRLELGKVGLPRRPRMDRIAAALELPLGELLARSGWSGADDAFRPQPATRSIAPEPPVRPSAFTSQGAAASPPRAEDLARFEHRSARLREALARSKELRNQSEDLCRQAYRAIALVEPARAASVIRARGTRRLSQSRTS